MDQFFLEVESLDGQELDLDQLNQNVSKLLDADPSLQVLSLIHI